MHTVWRPSLSAAGGRNLIACRHAGGHTCRPMKSSRCCSWSGVSNSSSTCCASSRLRLGPCVLCAGEILSLLPQALAQTTYLPSCLVSGLAPPQLLQLPHRYVTTILIAGSQKPECERNDSTHGADMQCRTYEASRAA